MNSLCAGELTIDVIDQPDRLRLEWRGKSTDRQPQQVLAPFFGALLTETTSRKSGVEMHFEQLVHFNSSTIGCLIHFIHEARSKSVPLILFYDRTLVWQRMSFDALRVFGANDALFELRTVDGHA
jgi:hypothetical protein